MISKEELYDLYIKKQTSLKDFKKKYKISTSTLYRYLKKYNIEKNRFTKLDKTTMYYLYIIQNKTMKEIGKLYNCDRKAIAYLCKKYNIKKEYITKEKIQKAFNSSNSYKEMSLKLNIHPSTCSKYCQKYGFKYNFCIKDKYYSQKTINIIQNLYEEELLSCRDISKKLNIPRYIIQNIIKEKNFRYNSISPTIKISYTALYNLYVNKKLSTISISKMYNVGYGVINNLLHEYNIDINTSYSQSSFEIELENYIKKYNFDYILNDRTILNGKEIDIYIPMLKLGIELNGNYWHSEKKKPKTYHQDKSIIAEENGIFLYHIFEYEWFNKKSIIINQLNNLLGINQNKIYVRNCIIKEVSTKEKSIFLESNHIQGDDKSSIKIGLYHNNELVSLMTFVKYRFNYNYEWKLSRFCSKSNNDIIGGANKLFKYFLEQYNPKSIISFSNIAHTKGNLYNSLGFQFKYVTSPSYVWCKNQNIKSRYQSQKHNLLKQNYFGNSENDIMHSLGYYKIYDCGNKVWVFHKIDKNN